MVKKGICLAMADRVFNGVVYYLVPDFRLCPFVFRIVDCGKI